MKIVKQILIPVALLLLEYHGVSQTPITNDVLLNVFNIKVNSIVGTGFLVGNPEKNFLVTARHILDGKYSNKDSITYFVNGDGKWSTFKGKVLLHENEKVDIAVIESDSLKGWHTPFKSNQPSNFIGEDVLFLGFPYDILPSRNLSESELYYPLPIPKKAMFSAIVEIEGIVHFLYDGHNNPGYSGGPIFSKDWKEKPLPRYHRLVAIVSGLYTGQIKIETDKGVMSFQENSGILIGVSSHYIGEILKQNGYIDAW